jgi:hypothetical protein
MYENYIYRDFSYLDEEFRSGFYGHIEIWFHTDLIQVQIDGLRENEGENYHPQAFMEIKYPENIPLYDLTTIILDKLTEDHKYCLGRLKHRDFIFCCDDFVKEHPELCNFNRKENLDGSIWMDFTRENMKYVTAKTLYERFLDDKDITIYGEIDLSGNFTYDYPVVGCGVDKEFYKMTRGRLHTDVGYDMIRKEYYYVDDRIVKKKEYEHSCVYRGFNTYYGMHWLAFYGCIELFLLKHNRIYCVINIFDTKGHPMEYGDNQNIFIVKYPDNIPLYDVFDKILNTIHRKHIDNLLYFSTFKDMILCSNKLVQEHPELCNNNVAENYMCCEWMGFTPENVKYLDYYEKPILYDTMSTMDYSGNFNYNVETRYPKLPISW